MNLGFDKKYFSKNVFWSSLTVGFDFLAGLVFSIIIGNYFDQVTAGKYFFIISFIGVMSIFSLQGMDIPVTNRFLKKDYSNYSSIVKIRFLGGLVGTLIILILSLGLFIFGESYWTLFLVVAPYICLNVFSIYLRFLYSKDEFKKISLLSVFKSSIYYGIAILLIITKEFSLFTILFFFLYLQVLFDIFSYLYIGRKYNLWNKNQQQLSKENLENGIKFTFGNLLEKVSAHLDKFLVMLFLDLRSLAIYGFSLILPKSINNIADKFLFYLFYKKLSQKSPKIIKFKFLMFIIFLFVSTIPLIISIPHLFNFFLPKYTESIFYSQLLTFLIPFNLANILILRLLESKNLPKVVINISIITKTIQTISFIVLIGLFGIVGAVISRYLKDILTFILNSYYFFVRLQIK